MPDWDTYFYLSVFDNFAGRHITAQAASLLLEDATALLDEVIRDVKR